jgi:hypothetical protein
MAAGVASTTKLQPLLGWRRGCREYNHFIRQRIRVHGNVCNDRRIQGTVLQLFLGCVFAHHGERFHLIQYVPSIQHAPEDRM